MFTVYRIILLLHILTAIVGFGGLIAHSIYNANAFRSSAGNAVTVFKSTAAVTNIAHYAMYAVLPLGIVLISLSGSDSVPTEFSMGAPWVSASFVVWIALVGIAHALVTKNVKALGARAAELPPDTVMADDPDALGLTKQLALGEGLTQLLLVVALILMIWQPGQ